MKGETRLIDITAHQLLNLVDQAITGKLKTLEERLNTQEQALALQAPSFRSPEACIYLGNVSPSFLSNLVTKHNLPRTKCGDSYRYHRDHLDHFMNGGSFTKEGAMVFNTELKPVKTATK